MQVGDSKLFQEFSGQILRSMYGRGALSVLSESFTGGMDSTVQYLLSRSSLEVIAVNIRNATKDTFNISIECRVTGTGPISSTIAPMEVDLLFESVKFGRMRLPEIQTSAWGTTVLIMEQTVAVSNMDTYRAYVRSIIVNDETAFRLDNGNCQVHALGLSASCKYAMEVPIRGMGGLNAEIESVTRGSEDKKGELLVKVRFRNKTPVQIDNGVVKFELRTIEGAVVARLSGSLQISRGTFTVDLTGSSEGEARVSESKKLRLLGIGTKEKSWCNETIQYIDSMVELTGRDRRTLGMA